jgi:hypothetical protein
VVRPPPFGQGGGQSTSIWPEWLTTPTAYGGGSATPFFPIFFFNNGTLGINT